MSSATLEIQSIRQLQEEMTPLENGYFYCSVSDLAPGSLYMYRLNGGQSRSDPASKSQPRGVHGPSQVCSDSFAWTDSVWQGFSLRESVLYELHVGTFTPEGTFDAIIPRLSALKSLGVSTLEIMPVAQFPGERNWGYDGVHPFAVQDSYGGRDSLKRLVNACHNAGIAVALDVVYNHLGPEGNYLSDFGPYFSDTYKTPWGQALNFDGPGSDEVRRFFIENALCWVAEFHIDALRLDAIHAIVDVSPKRFLEELGERIDAYARQSARLIHIIAENDRNDPRVVFPRHEGGFGFHSQWNDDFHHSIHALLTGEQQGYYGDFGSTDDLSAAFREGYVYSGKFSKFRHRRQGGPVQKTAPYNFVHFIQNHDQVGNRANGERLAQLVCFESLKLAASALLLSPFVPMLFMGEEYGETAPFLYFVSHGDPDLVDKVQVGRRSEFAKFDWHVVVPAPQSHETFLRSKLNWNLREEEPHKTLLSFYTELLAIRRANPSLSHSTKADCSVRVSDRTALIVERWHESNRTIAFFNFAHSAVMLKCSLRLGVWKKLIASAEKKWKGPDVGAPDVLKGTERVKLQLAPHSLALYRLSEREASVD